MPESNGRFRLRLLDRARRDPQLARRLRELADWDRLLSTPHPHLQLGLAQSPGQIRSLQVNLQAGCDALARELGEGGEDPRVLARELERNVRAWVRDLDEQG
ncbi:MAG: hypothetical protein AB1439_06155 [candidate division FCPU426 bacterium]